VYDIDRRTGKQTDRHEEANSRFSLTRIRLVRAAGRDTLAREERCVNCGEERISEDIKKRKRIDKETTKKII
jgi:hypothetical protein